MSGSGGDRGYDYQADCYAYVAAHGLAGQPLGWFEDAVDIPVAILMETGGPGDDMQITTATGHRIELQAKHALKRGEKFDDAIRRVTHGLNDDPALRAVLMIDRESSEIIREDLRRDIVRLGQGRTDGLSNITREVLDGLRSERVAVECIFDRLRIVVVDLDDGSDGAAAACSLLGQIVEPAKAQTAFRLLGKRGHRMMKGRGQDTVDRIAAYLDHEIGLTGTPRSPYLTLGRFRRWLLSATSDFYCPAVGRRFPIAQVWNRVRLLEPEHSNSESAVWGGEALKKQIERYREWYRLADRSRSDRVTDAEHFVGFHRRSVIVGGPGTGKTTLSKLIVHHFGAAEQLVVRVQLRVVTALLARGRTFEQALIEAAIDGSGLSIQEGSSVLASSELLVADGLDECDPYRADIAAGLKSWSDGHSNTAVCVFTRPVGHAPDLLPGFIHAELTPLDERAVEARVSWLVESLIPDPVRAATLAAPFILDVVNSSTNPIASMAARNPLLLSFLVRLYVDGVPIRNSRALLYESVIELMRKTKSLERREGAELERATAWLAAEVMGWLSIEQPGRNVGELTAALTEELGGGCDGERRAENAIDFWLERGLVEKLTAGTLDAIVFVHPALGEYAAGRRIANMKPATLRDWVEKVRTQAKWREPLLLAAGAGAAEGVVEALLRYDDPAEPASTEATLAAAAIAEAEGGDIEPALIQRVAESLSQRLQSPIPLVAVDAGLGLMMLAPLAPDTVGPIGNALWDHHQPWTRLAATAACLAAGPTFSDVERVRQWVEAFEPLRKFDLGGRAAALPDEAYELAVKALPLAIRRIATEMHADRAKPCIVGFLSRDDLTIGMLDRVTHVLMEEPFLDWVREARRREHDQAAQFYEGFSAAQARWRKADGVFLACVLRATDSARESTVHTSTFQNLGTLFAAMRGWECPMPDWAVLARDTDQSALAEIIRGTIAATGLNPPEVAREANALLGGSNETSESLTSNLPQLSVEPRWTQACRVRLDAAKIAAGLHHPSRPVAFTAAELLLAGVGGEQTPHLLRQVLNDGQGLTLYLVGQLAEAVWGDSAFDVVHGRLTRPLSAGCGYLYKPLIRLANPTQASVAIQRAIEGLEASDPTIATDAAESLKSVPVDLLAPWVDHLNRAFHHWGERGSWCDRCDRTVMSGSCDQCHIVPPNPRPHLTHMLARLGTLSVDKLVELTRDSWSGVAEEARKALAGAAARDDQVMATVLREVGDGKVQLAVLNELLMLPVETVRKASNLLMKLLKSDRAEVRARILLAVGGGWLERDTARSVARSMLSDESSLVRNNATRVLGSLRSSTA